MPGRCDTIVLSDSTGSLAVMMQANPFGNAKPVDTVAKLKELEERDAKRKVVLPHSSCCPLASLLNADLHRCWHLLVKRLRCTASSMIHAA